MNTLARNLPGGRRARSDCAFLTSIRRGGVLSCQRNEILWPMPSSTAPTFCSSAFEGRAARTTSSHYANAQDIFVQGDRADAVFRVEDGNVKLTVRAAGGKRAVIAVLHPGECFGEGCMEGTTVRCSTATAMRGCTIARVTKVHLLARLRAEPALARLFIAYLLKRVARSEDDQADRLLNSSERRLARLLIRIANSPCESPPTPVANLDQGTLAQMVGTTRSRVSFFMNRFRKQGFIDYNGHLHVHKALLTFLRGASEAAESLNAKLLSSASPRVIPIRTRAP